MAPTIGAKWVEVVRLKPAPLASESNLSKKWCQFQRMERTLGSSLPTWAAVASRFNQQRCQDHFGGELPEMPKITVQ